MGRFAQPVDPDAVTDAALLSVQRPGTHHSAHHNNYYRYPPHPANLITELASSDTAE